MIKRTRLTEKQKRGISTDYSNGIPSSVIQKKYKVSPASVHRNKSYGLPMVETERVDLSVAEYNQLLDLFSKLELFSKLVLSFKK